MSVLCCRVPNFLLTLACRQTPHLAQRPVALVGADERLCAVSPEARQFGVHVEMEPRQAQMRCPDLMLHPLDLEPCRIVQNVWLSTMTAWGLPVEAQGWGMAYIDLHGVADRQSETQPLAVELGRNLRRELGDDLQPALGWDSGKFTARAAAASTQPGRIRLVGKEDEARFLGPLPITLLPLPMPVLQQLHWLGVRTLGQYAALPSAAVTQRFGKQGYIAQWWAQGRDDRPVRSSAASAEPPVEVELDPPTDLLPPVVEASMNALRPLLEVAADRLEGCTRLPVALHFVEGSVERAEAGFVEPVSTLARIRAALTRLLSSVRWPAELSRLMIGPLAFAELTVRQATLFADPDDASSYSTGDLAQSLGGRFGPIAYQGIVLDASHPVIERRSSFRLLP